MQHVDRICRNPRVYRIPVISPHAGFGRIGLDTQREKDYNSFTRRLDNQLIRLDMHHINYHIPMPEGPMADRIAYTENTTLTFYNSRNYPMVYTTDGSDPQTSSTKYEKPLYFNKDVTVKIATMLPSGKLSPVRSIEVVHEKLMPATEKAPNPVSS